MRFLLTFFRIFVMVALFYNWEKEFVYGVHYVSSYINSWTCPYGRWIESVTLDIYDPFYGTFIGFLMGPVTSPERAGLMCMRFSKG